MKQENERAPVKYRRKSLISERTHTHTRPRLINLPSEVTISFVAHRCGVWSAGLIARASEYESCALEYRGIMQIVCSPEGGFFFPPVALVGVRLQVRLLLANNTAVGTAMLMFHYILCINCSTMDDYANRPLLHARLICFLATFFHLICHGELARREFEIYEVLPLSLIVWQAQCVSTCANCDAKRRLAAPFLFGKFILLRAKGNC